MERIQDLFDDTTATCIADIYEGVANERQAERALDALEKIEGTINDAEAAFDRKELDPILKENIAKQLENAKKTTLTLKRFLEDAQGVGATIDQQQARRDASSLHLILNALQQIAAEVDRDYVKRPHLMHALPPCTGCKTCGDTCETEDKGEEEKD
ncbi:hypothetical protein EF808_05955 [archaeon]|nr:MAG: hypothetical protein EF808_05955 [archaeon]